MGILPNASDIYACSTRPSSPCLCAQIEILIMHHLQNRTKIERYRTVFQLSLRLISGDYLPWTGPMRKVTLPGGASMAFRWLDILIYVSTTALPRIISRIRFFSFELLNLATWKIVTAFMNTSAHPSTLSSARPYVGSI